MIVYRITKKEYANDISGFGASVYGGRWNKKGTPVLYTGESEEIALLETIVNTPPMFIPKLSLVTIEIPDDSITEVKRENLPDNWYSFPAPTILAEIGREWIAENKTIALKVPSCIVHSAHNYILNCNHYRYKEVKIIEIKDFHFDIRLKK